MVLQLHFDHHVKVMMNDYSSWKGAIYCMPKEKVCPNFRYSNSYKIIITLCVVTKVVQIQSVIVIAWFMSLSGCSSGRWRKGWCASVAKSLSSNHALKSLVPTLCLVVVVIYGLADKLRNFVAGIFIPQYHYPYAVALCFGQVSACWQFTLHNQQNQIIICLSTVPVYLNNCVTMLHTVSYFMFSLHSITKGICLGCNYMCLQVISEISNWAARTLWGPMQTYYTEAMFGAQMEWDSSDNSS